MKHAFLSLFPLSHRFGIERDDVSPRPGEELRGERDVVDRVSRLVVVAFRELRTRDADEEERKEEEEDASAAGHSSDLLLGKRSSVFVRKSLFKRKTWRDLFVEREREQESKREQERERRRETTGEGVHPARELRAFRTKEEEEEEEGKEPTRFLFYFPSLLSLSLESTHARAREGCS